MTYGRSTALLVVDVQNDFADPSGSLFVRGGDQVFEFINSEIADAVEQGALVVYTRDWHPETTPHFEKDGGIWPVHCVGGTWGAEFHPDLRIIESGHFLKKGQGGEDGYSAFGMRDPVTGEESSTGLAEELRRRGIDSVVVVGLALDYCVKESALDARKEGLETTLLADGTRAVDLSPGDGVRAAAALAGAGVEVL